jgi:hypothetical protein
MRAVARLVVAQVEGDGAVEVDHPPHTPLVFASSNSNATGGGPALLADLP